MMITDVETLYFKWLVGLMEAPTQAVGRLSWMLHRNTFMREVGNDSNRAVEGSRLRGRFLSDYSDADIDPRKVSLLMEEECSWFEMLIALSEALDFLYEGGIQERFLELVDNLGLTKILSSPSDGRYDEVDQELVDLATTRVDYSRFDSNGHGGLFPLNKPNHPDQREVEIWEQHAAYFREKLEGVVWTSIS
jgi:hypothetical protein